VVGRRKDVVVVMKLAIREETVTCDSGGWMAEAVTYAKGGEDVRGGESR